MAPVYVNGKRVTLNPSDIIGKGGEADIYLLDPQTVLKLYKKKDDPDYLGNVEAQQGALVRLKEHQHKLPDFPTGLPGQVIAPKALAYEKSAAGTVVGYTMQYLQGLEVLLRLNDRLYREAGGIDGNQVLGVFRNLRYLVEQVHQAGVVIGDFNDLNVLYKLPSKPMDSPTTYMVDADSMQFGTYFCRTFTTRFVDPLLSDPQKLYLVKPHTVDSDWYAFAIMLFQSLLYVGPYGGVHKPPQGKRLQHDARVLQRLTLFDPNVIYPKPAIPYDRLPDELLTYFQQVYERDDRGAFPENLLLTLRWTDCTNCGSAHARSRCPVCAAPGAVKETVVIRGKVTATRTFKTKGQILHAVVQDKLRFLYHEDGKFRREGNLPILDGSLDPKLRFRIARDRTLIAKGDHLIVLGDDKPTQLTTGMVGELPIFDAADKEYFWIDGDQLRRSAHIGSTYMGNILPNRTMFWTGKHLGFGFYQAGLLQRMFKFEVGGQGLSELLRLPNIPGQMVDATCVSSDRLIWFLTTTQENGKLVNHCYIIDLNGVLVGYETADQSTESWLNAGIRGHFATAKSLFVATDEGIVRVESDSSASKPGNLAIAETFPDTEPFVDTTSQLLPGPGGIYVISPHEITILRIS